MGFLFFSLSNDDKGKKRSSQFRGNYIYLLKTSQKKMVESILAAQNFLIPLHL